MMGRFGPASIARALPGAFVLLGLIAGWGFGAHDRTIAPSSDPVWDSIPGTLVSFEMIPVPAGTVTIQTDSGAIDVDVAPFLIGKTEVTWNEYLCLPAGPAAGAPDLS
jgi:hypothetical protein